MLYYYFSWYDEHLKECEGGNDDELRIRVVLLTNDRDNREKAKKQGIISFTAQEYVESLEGCEGLADRLAHPSQTGQDEVDDKKRRKWVYPEHLHLTKIQAGLKSGKYLQVFSGRTFHFRASTLCVKCQFRSIRQFAKYFDREFVSQENF